MKAVLLAAGHEFTYSPMVDTLPVPLVPIGGRPFVHHVIERLVEEGHDEIHLLLWHRPEMIEEELGDGQRWGCRLHYHLLRDPERPLERVRLLSGTWGEESVTIGCADTLPGKACRGVMETSSSRTGMPTFYVMEDHPEQSAVDWMYWAEWARVPASTLASIPVECAMSELPLVIQQQARGGSQLLRVDSVLSVRSPEEALLSERAVLSGNFDELFFVGYAPEPGVRLARNVSIHPSATIHPPVSIGENCSIGRRASIGPYASIGDNCALAERTSIRDAILAPGTYCGPDLEVRDCIARHGVLLHVSMRVGLSIGDDHILGRLDPDRLSSSLSRRLQRTLAGILFLGLLPLTLLVATVLLVARRGPVLRHRPVLRTPAGTEDRASWRETRVPTFGIGRTRLSRLDALPALLAVARGEIALVGLPPRSAEQVEALPHEWRQAYLEGRVGIATPHELGNGHENRDQAYLLEAIHVRRSDIRDRLRIFWRFLLAPKREAGGARMSFRRRRRIVWRRGSSAKAHAEETVS